MSKDIILKYFKQIVNFHWNRYIHNLLLKHKYIIADGIKI